MKIEIDVVIPFYQEIDLLPKAIESVATQKAFCDIQFNIFVINDGPYTNEEISKKLFYDHVLVLRNTLGQGPGSARRLGMREGKAEWVAFLDADDYWLPNRFDQVFCDHFLNGDFIATAYTIDENKIVKPPTQISDAVDVLTKRGIGTSTVLLNRKKLNGIEFSDLRYGQDIDYWYRLFRKLNNFKYISDPRVSVVYRSGGSTKNKFVQLIYFVKILLKNRINFLQSTKAIYTYVLSGLINHYVKRK